MINLHTLPRWMQALSIFNRPKPAVVAQATQACLTPDTSLAEFQVTEMVVGGARAAVLQVRGAVTCQTYLDFIAAAETAYRHGARRLVVDLSGVAALELSGLFALYSIASLYAGEGLLDPEHGWPTLCAVGDEVPETLPRHVKLVSPSAVAAAALGRAIFCRCFEVYASLDAAIVSFEPGVG